ncbi:ejaculatory bulb-specific protein 3-like [Cimex lectularius]|uniref:Chemosensory protein n=1 Tax=Cimex lectularius TaxID=79782 RepID=A0A8I6S6A6_CIMLE|nr:ejaculatory bulb-specific protein 3-like [Cimex lectularius]
MKSFVLILAFAAVALAAERYTTRYDNIDLDEILRNQRLYKKYFECLTNKGRCTPDGKELKDALPEALATGCNKCTPKQRSGSEKVIRYLINNKPRDYAVLERIYDPSGTYKKKYQADAKKLGLRV